MSGHHHDSPLVRSSTKRTLDQSQQGHQDVASYEGHSPRISTNPTSTSTTTTTTRGTGPPPPPAPPSHVATFPHPLASTPTPSLAGPSASSPSLSHTSPPTAAIPTSLSNATLGESATKKRITRRRAILSCSACTSRKIRCERVAGSQAGTSCKACEKRGEGQWCDSGSATSSSAGGTTAAGGGGGGDRAASVRSGQNLSIEDCGRHRADLERRLLHLESIVLGSQAFPPPHHAHRPSTASSHAHQASTVHDSQSQNGPSPDIARPSTSNSNNAGLNGSTGHGANAGMRESSVSTSVGAGRNGSRDRRALRAKSEELSETEEAAMTLEDIAVNVRVSQPSTVRQQSASTVVPYGPSAALPPPTSTSRYRDSLLVPPISKRWRYVLEDLYSELPSRNKMDFLIHYFFGNVSWFWLPYHAPTFLAEYEAFHQLLHEGRQLEVDPLWLSVLFLTLAISANAIDYIPPGTDFHYDELTKMYASFFENGRAALDCGDGYGSHARLRTIQAVVLLGPLALNSGDPGRVDILIPYVAATMRLAQQLGLDKLGNDPTTMPAFEDAALPSGNNSLRRELALRAFHGLCHIDQTTFRCRPVLPMHLVDSDFPGNYNDQDLSLDKFSAPAPSHVRTISAYETLRFRVGMIQRTYHDTVVLDPSYTYSTVMHCDAEMRALLDEYDLERPEPNETSPMFWARLFSLQNVNIRLIRFHRPFASKGYRDQAFRKSTDIAVAAARVVLETQKELDRTQCPLVKDCYQLNHIQIAIVVLFSTIWYDQDLDSQPSADYRLVQDSLACFHRYLSSIRERVRNVARQSLLVAQCLFETLHNRATGKSTETFAQMLKRISMIVTEAERRAAATTSTASNGVSIVPSAASANGSLSTANNGGALGPTAQSYLSHPDPNALAPMHSAHLASQGHPHQVQQQQHQHAAQHHQQPQLHAVVPHSAGPVDARGVLIDHGMPGAETGPYYQQQAAGGPGHHARTGSMSDSSITSHDLHYDIGSDWGLEWMPSFPI
ncbi:hypothetical protein JCM10212_000591 [Sporobolomyces blumeae]